MTNNLPATVEASSSAIAAVLPQLKQVAEYSDDEDELRSALALAKGMEVTAKEMGIAEIHAELSWIRETALRRLSRFERPRIRDRAPDGTIVTSSDDGPPLSGADRQRLSLARQRHADLSDEEFDKLREKSLQNNVPATPMLIRGADIKTSAPSHAPQYLSTKGALSMLQQYRPEDVGELEGDEREDLRAMYRVIADYALTALKALGEPVAPMNGSNLPTALMLYNEMAERAGLAKAQRLTTTRKSKLARRLTECGGIEGWKDALEKVEASPFLTGDNSQGWRASFDFLLQESSFTKLMEGVYSTSPNLGAQTERRALDIMEEMLG